MSNDDKDHKKEHWEAVYRTKSDNQVSWYQERPEMSIGLIRQYQTDHDRAIIDIGAGNSNLCTCLADLGYTRLTALDISAVALDRCRLKSGAQGTKIHWLVSDVLALNTPQRFALWHDRAAFHFLTDEADIARYAHSAGTHLETGGIMIIAAFSLQGPQKCSGLNVTRYSPQTMAPVFAENFRLIHSLTQTHTTPNGAAQDFTWCLFQRKGIA